MVDLTKLSKEVHQNAVDHGFWVKPRTFGDLISLCHSELSEAFEEFRSGHAANETYIGDEGKLEGVPTELADVVIRIMDMCGYYDIDLEKAVLDKIENNKSRPYLHGGKLL